MGYTINQSHKHQWLSDTVKEVRVLERSLLRDTQERPTNHCWKASPSQLLEGWPEEEVLRESASSSTTTPETSSRASWVESSEMPLPTLSTPRERPSPLWMSSTLLRDKAEPSMVSVHKRSTDRLIH